MFSRLFTCVFALASLCSVASAQTGTALVRHAPVVNGSVTGSIQMMTGEAATLNSGAGISANLLVPGTPTITRNGAGTYGGTQVGTGSTSPSGYSIILNSSSTLGHVVTRTDPVALPTVTAPTAPSGTRTVAINNASDSPGSFATLRNLTLNSNVGQFAIPAGSYGNFTANSGSGFTLGVVGATQPAVYNFQNLTLNSSSSFQIVGPVIVTLAAGSSWNGAVGSSTNPVWLKLNLYAGGLTLNNGSAFYGYVTAPSTTGTVIINSSATLTGGVICDRLTINSNGQLRLGNVPPSVALTAPANNTVVTAPASVTLTATASDSDGTVTKVEFFNGTTLLGQSTTAPYQFIWNSVAPGTYTLTAKATDNTGASTTSSAVTLIVNAPPSVSLTAPTNGATFTAPASFTLTASAADSDGSVAKVEFFRGTTLLGQSTVAPYQFAVSGLAAGSYSFTAKATDNTGASTTSSAVTLSVNAPPSVSLTAPAGGATFTAPASFTLTASAADSDGTVAKVEFFRDTTLLGQATVAPYQFAVSGLAAGSYSFTAKATDNAGATTTSAAVTVVVNTPPTVTLTAPVAGATFVAPASITLNASASASAGTIAKVEFFQGTTKIGESLTAPYTFTWTSVAAGSYSLTAKATDSGGGTATSTPVSITVNVPPTVALTAPAASASFSAPATIVLAATATGGSGTVTKVEFFQGSTKLGEATAAPYQLTWTGVPAGSYSLTAKVTASTGLTATSSAIAVTVVGPTALLEIMMPTNGQVVDHVRPMLAAHYAGTTAVKPDSFHVYVDGRDYSAEAMLEDGEVMVDPRFNFTQGSHTLKIDWIDQGHLVATDSVVFTVNSLVTGTRFEAEVRSITGEPLANVRVRGGNQETFTGSNGKFSFDNLPDEQTVFHFDPSTVTGGQTYTPVNLAFEVLAGQRVRIERPIYLAEFNSNDGVLVQSDSPTDQIVTNASIPGVRLIIPAHTIIAFPDGSTQSRVTLVNIPVDRSPNCLGPGFRPSRLIAIQPENTLLSKPAQLITPNDYRLPEGFPVGLKSLNIETGRFSQVGYGQVTGNEMVELPGSGLTTFDWHCLHMIPGGWEEVDCDKWNQEEQNKKVCSTMSMKAGALEEEHTTTSYMSLGQPRSVTLHYSSASAAPSIAMSGTVKMLPTYLPYPADASGNIIVGAPPVQSISASLSGSFGTAQTYYDPSAIAPSWGSARISGHANVSAGSLPTGVYTATARTSAYVPAEDRVTYFVNSTERILQSAVYNGRELNPAFGTGWSVTNVDRLLLGRGADALLATGEGKLQQFTAHGTVARFSEANFSAELGTLEGAITEGDVSVSPGLGVSRAVEGARAFLLRGNAGSATEAVLRIPFNNLGYKRVAFDADLFGDIPMQARAIMRASFHWSNSRTTDYAEGGSFAFDDEGDCDVQGSLILAGADTGFAQRSGWRNFYIYLPSGSVGKKGYLEIVVSRFGSGGGGGYGGGGGGGIVAASVTPGLEGTTIRKASERSKTTGIHAADASGFANTAVLVDNFRAEGQLLGFVPAFVAETGDASKLVLDIVASEYVRSFPDGTQQVFDTQGRQIRTNDRQGNTTTYAYIDGDGDGNAFELGSITDPVGLVTTFNYSGGKLRQIVDPAARITQFSYDGSGNLTQITNPDGTTRVFGYDAGGRMIRQADGLGQARQYSYGSSGRLAGVVRADGSSYSYAPMQAAGAASASTGSFGAPAPVATAARATQVVDGNGNPESSSLNTNGQPEKIVDSNSGVTQITYTSDRLPHIISRPNGSAISVAYDSNQKPIAVSPVMAGDVDVYHFSYGAFSLLTEMRDPLDRRTTYSYDAQGNLTEIRDANGGVVVLTNNSRGQPLTITDQRGSVTTIVYDSYGRTASVTDPLSRKTSFTYDTAGNLLTTTDPLGHVTTYQYDAGNKVVQITAPDGGVTRFQYDNNKSLTKVIDPLGRETAWTYDARQRPVTKTDALSQLTRLVYDAVGNLTKITDPAGKDWTFAFDGLNRKISGTDPQGHISHWEYDGIGQVTKVIRPDGTFSQNVYNFENRLARAIAPDGSATQFDYDSASQLTTITDALNGTTRFSYDLLGRKTSITDPLSRQNQVVYDAVGNILQRIRPDTRFTAYEYDAANQLVKVTAPDSGIVNYSYDPVGNVTGLADANGRTRQFAYDAMNRVQRETDALGRTRDFTYDLAGNRTSLKRRDAAVITFAYDPLNRLVAKQLPAVNGLPADPVSFSYDVLGNLTAVSDNDSSIGNGYNTLSLLTQTTQTFGGNSVALTYAYDALNRRAQMTDLSGQTNYTYDARSRLTQMKDSSNRNYTFAYDALSRLTSQVLPNGVTSTRSYDAASQLLSIAHTKSATTLAQVDYTYDALGNRASEGREDGNTRAFNYDPANRVTSSASSLPAVPNENFAYDLEGNWTTESRVHDAANELTADTFSDYFYDTEGNLIRRANRLIPADVVNYTYDAENRLVQVIVGPTATPTSTTTYRYDGLGRRITRTVNGSTTRYILDGDNARLELSGANILLAVNHSAGLDNLLARDTTSGTDFLLHDGLNSTIGLTDPAGSVTERYRYSSFGQLTVMAPDFSLRASVPKLSYTYTGRDWEPETGNYFYRARYYSPSAGRFTSPDPLGIASGLNYYAYVANNPISKFDPTGLTETSSNDPDPRLGPIYPGDVYDPQQGSYVAPIVPKENPVGPYNPSGHGIVYEPSAGAYSGVGGGGGSAWLIMDNGVAASYVYGGGGIGLGGKAVAFQVGPANGVYYPSDYAGNFFNGSANLLGVGGSYAFWPEGADAKTWGIAPGAGVSLSLQYYKLTGYWETGKTPAEVLAMIKRGELKYPKCR